MSARARQFTPFTRVGWPIGTNWLLSARPFRACLMFTWPMVKTKTPHWIGFETFADVYVDVVIRYA